MSSKTVNTNLEDVMADRIGRYSKYVIQDRALPDVRDGLKPVQRRILYAMKKEGNTSEKPHRKSAKTVGLVIGNYHPHGDSSVYEALVRMGQDWKMNAILIDMHGNKGSIDNDPPAAMRYTEARLSKIANELIGDVENETVNFVYNFDDTDKEPTVFPAKFLNILVNGASGIAYGYATNIPTHNITEVTQACMQRLNNPNSTLEDIMQYIKGPDFPTGAIVSGTKEIKEAYTSGKSRLLLRAKVGFEEKRGNRTLVISEIPYGVVKSELVEKIDTIRANKEIEGILEVRDESGRAGLRIAVDLKKDVNEELLLNYLYKNTSLQVSFNCNMVCIVDKKPLLMGLINIIDAYLAFYEEFTLKLTAYQIEKLKARMHLLEGLIKAVSILDEVIATIRKSQDKADAKENLIKAYDFSEAQAEAIVMLQLYRLTNTDIVALQKELKEKKQELKEKEAILNNRDVLKSTISKQMQEIINNYGSPRKTIVSDQFDEITIAQKDLITAESVMASISRGGYIKQASLRSYKASDCQSTVRENDALLASGEVNTLDTLVVSAKSGSYACLNVHELGESKWKDIGEHVNKYVNFAPDDKLIDCFVTRDFCGKQVISISAKGQIRRCQLGEYELQRRSKISSSFKIKENDELVRSLLIAEDDEIIIVTKQGWCLRYPAREISLTGMNTQGMRALNLSSGDEVVDMQLSQGKEMLCIIANNGTKRLRLADIESSSRVKKGMMLCKRNKSNPVEVLAAFCGNLNDEINLQNGEITTILVKDISLMDAQSSFSGTIKISKNTQVIKGFQYTAKPSDGE